MTLKLEKTLAMVNAQGRATGGKTKAAGRQKKIADKTMADVGKKVL